MEEFVRMIYKQWRHKKENTDAIDWGDYSKTIEKIYDFLNEDIAFDLENAINEKAWRIEENAFITGFSYACKCLSDGKIDLKGGAV